MMEDIGMKIATFVAVAIAILTSIPLLGQEAGASAQGSSRTSAAGTQVSDSAHAGANASAAGASAGGSASGAASGTAGASSAAAGTRGAVGYGDEAASHAFEMTSVTGELEGKLDSKTAKAGERVVVKTTEKIQTADGTLFPKGSHLIGHITEVQAFSKEHGAAQMGIALDRAELKNGQSVEIFTLIRGVSPSPSVAETNAMAEGDSFAGGGGAMGGQMGGAQPAMGGGGMGGGGRSGGGGGLAGGTLNGAGGIAGGAAGAAGGTLDRADRTTGDLDSQETGALGAKTDAGAVEAAGHGDLGLDTGAHAAEAARAVPRPTRVPGLMLAGSSTASGLLLASRKNIELESGTQMQLGIVAK